MKKISSVGSLLSPDIHVPSGFNFSSAKAGIKASGNLDLAMVEIPDSGNAAAMFTRNLVVAAPVVVGRKNLQSSRGRVRALIVNSGNANCATGAAGRKACDAVCKATAQALGTPVAQVIPSSTGIIGVPFPTEKILAALPDLIAGKRPDPDAAMTFARAIMTTDTRPKFASSAFQVKGKEVALLGIAKGAGMIHPDMATMLVYLFTDLDASPRELQKSLRMAVDNSLNCISIDGDTSTNDTVLLMASGSSGVTFAKGGKEFSAALQAVCQSLAEQIIGDGEGVKHVVHLQIEEARTREEAMRIARTIAHSALVKTAWAGADPNWGRMLAAMGRSGVTLDPGKVDIYLGEQRVCRKGMAHPFDATSAHEYLQQPSYEIRIVLRRGKSNLRFLTCDLTAEYVHINADYST